MTREEFSDKASVLCHSLSTNLHEKMLKAWDALTELEKIRHSRDDRPYFIVRAIALIELPKAADNCFNVEAIRWLVPTLRRILNKRYY